MAIRSSISELRSSKVKRLVLLLLDWFAREARDLPWRRTHDPHAIWVSEIMLQQTQVKTVIPYWERWMRELPTIEALAKASPDKIHKLWEGLGYYTRVRNMQQAAQQIVAQQDLKHRSSRGHEALTEIGNRKSEIGNGIESPDVGCYTFPETFDEVLALPGIGRYTAGAICSIAFNQPTPILDGNVIRVLTRIFGVAENPKEKRTNARLWELAEELVRNSKFKIKNSKLCCSHLNQSMMELGALVCTPRNPQCLLCPVRKHCVAFKENRIEGLPNLGKRAGATARHFMAFVIERDGKFLVRQRPENVLNAHLWEFPNVEVNGSKSAPDKIFQDHFASKPGQIRLLYTVKHSITRYRITLDAFHVRFEGLRSAGSDDSRRRGTPPSGIWLPASEFDSLAFTAAHKKLASFAAKCILSGP